MINKIKDYYFKYNQLDDIFVGIFIFLMVFSVLQLWQKKFWDNHTLGGDEPIYLALTHNIVYNHTLNLEKFLSEKQWTNIKYEKTFDSSVTEWILTPPAPQAKPNTQFSIHNFGYPLTIALPYYFWGRFGVVVFMEIIGAILAVNIYYLARMVTKNKITATIITLSMSLSLPLAIYSYLSFSDLLAALLIAYSFRMKKNWLSYLAFAYLPFVKAKYYLQTLTFTVLYWWQNKKNYLMISIVAFSLLVLSVWFKYTYGSFSPLVLQDASGQFGSPIGLYGLIINWRYGLLPYSPIYFLIFPGFTLLYIYQRKLFWKLLSIVLPYYLMIGLFSYWTGDHAPPSRHLVAIIPLLAITIVAFFEHLKNRSLKIIFWVIYIILMCLSLLVSYHGITDPFSLYNLTPKTFLDFLSNLSVEKIFISSVSGNLKILLWFIILIVLTFSPLVISDRIKLKLFRSKVKS